MLAALAKEILFANWSPPCRVLVDNVSEWFSIFFLVYRCIIGFAVPLGSKSKGRIAASQRVGDFQLSGGM